MAKLKLPLDGFIEKIVSDPSKYEGSIYLQGFLGNSQQGEDYIALYADESLNNAVDIKRADIIHCVARSKDENALGGSHIWLNKGAEYVYGTATGDQERPRAKFFNGNLFDQYKLKTQIPGTWYPGCGDLTPPTIDSSTFCTQPPHTNLNDCRYTQKWFPCPEPTIYGLNCPTNSYLCTGPIKTVNCVTAICPPSIADGCPSTPAGCQTDIFQNQTQYAAYARQGNFGFGGGIPTPDTIVNCRTIIGCPSVFDSCPTDGNWICQIQTKGRPECRIVTTAVGPNCGVTKSVPACPPSNGNPYCVGIVTKFEPQCQETLLPPRCFIERPPFTQNIYQTSYYDWYYSGNR